MNSGVGGILLDKVATLLDDLEKDESQLNDPDALDELEEGRAFLLRFKEILEIQQRLNNGEKL